jgi:pyruvate formate lyase activating enzyme
LSSQPHSALYWHASQDGRIQCDLCPRDCKLHEGQRGACFVRARQDNRMVLTTYGRSSGFCIDPIEKKPLSHFYPSTPVLSFGTAGCNLTCRFCQNWDISKSRDMDTLAAEMSPQGIANLARHFRCQSVAYTYNDPVIFTEYAMDTADACHAVGVKSVAVTAGYIHDQARRDFFAKMDAANIDLKAFSDGFYQRQATARLQPVLDTLAYVYHATRCWLEITTLLIPGLNDSDAEIESMSRWLVRELGPDVPLHFTAYRPAHKMNTPTATPAATLARARHIARSEGLHHVYTGNVTDPAGQTTHCAHCGSTLIERDRYTLLSYRLNAHGACPDCDQPLAGRFATSPGTFGNQRIPIRLAPAPATHL